VRRAASGSAIVEGPPPITRAGEAVLMQQVSRHRIDESKLRADLDRFGRET
jgi:hypothetical protein